MKRNFTQCHRDRTRFVLLAGFAGGLAELIWIASYCLAVGADGWQVARAVAEAVVPAGASWLATPALGIVIHFLLSILLAGAFVTILAVLPSSRRSAGATIVTSLIALAAVWAVNFLVILPMVYPVFVHLLPYPVTLLSKLLFGLAMAQVLTAAPAPTTGAVLGARLARDGRRAVT